ncbi:lipopolysaccharide assembly protein LapB [Petrotoga sp. 9PWA.NaAc.5.4]|uniref:tetratricopeptide repeat protein n=1 Tax=Petrotoga sp. 9PWA.NaAc.5.4 TaxID=1434328 RepID=UPI000CC5694E|nr:hypothetical protein [Petrotoga sp. 9PWA.NaAc.5.4]PNR95647.1 hypothetical protein X924_04445 [Petrotoga sp. 9PWA.NaAc.5.4]
MENDEKYNEKLQKVYKIKEELEKELEKKGIKIPNKIQEKEKVRVVYKPDQEIEALNLSINKINNWFDIIIEDIDISNEKLAYFLELRLNNKPTLGYSNQFGLMHLFRGDFQKAEKFFLLKENDPDSQMNLSFLKIIRNDEDAINYLKNLMDKYPQNGLSYLSMSLFFLKKKEYYNAYNFIKIANKYLNYSIIDIALSLYEKDIQKALSYISKAYLEGKAKNKLNFFNYYISLFNSDLERASSFSSMIKEVKTPCQKCIKALSTNQIYTTEDYCLFGEQVLFQLGKPKTFALDNTELYDTILYAYFYNKNIKSFNNFCILISALFNKVSVLLFPAVNELQRNKQDIFSTNKNAIKFDLPGPLYYENLTKLLNDLEKQYQRKFDFSLDLPFFEALRLLFGWRMCQYLYNVDS